MDNFSPTTDAIFKRLDNIERLVQRYDPWWRVKKECAEMGWVLLGALLGVILFWSCVMDLGISFQLPSVIHC